MYGKRRPNQEQKTHSVKLGKRGYTLVELCIVMMLLAIIATMIASFSVLMKDFVADNSAEYDFLEDCFTCKEALRTWVAENDVTGTVFSVAEDGTLTVTESGTEKCVSFADSILAFEGKQKAGLNTIDGLAFTANEKLVKCIIYRNGKNGQRTEYSFVFSIRCGTIEEVAENE